MKERRIEPSMMVKSIAGNILWAMAIWATAWRTQIRKAERPQIWAMRIIVEVVPLKGGPRSLLMNCKIWYRMGRWYVDSIAMWGVFFRHCKGWRPKVRVHKDSKWTHSGYDSSLPIHFPDFFEKATGGHNAGDCHNLPCFVADNIQDTCKKRHTRLRSVNLLR